MGHRTIVAYRRGGGESSGAPDHDGDTLTYDLHYAHWGVDPAHLTPRTPFGGPPDVEWARRRATDLVEPEGGEVPEDPPTAVDPKPVATGVSFEDVCRHVDPVIHEALHVVDPSFAVRSYLVVSIGVESGSADRLEEADPAGSVGGRPSGGLIGYDDERDAAYLRGWMAGARALGDVAGLDDGALVRALRWLDPDRGTVIVLDDGRSG